MQALDISPKEYFDDEERMADLINVCFMEGEECVRPEDVQEVDSSSFGVVKWFNRRVTKQWHRDIIRKITLGVRFAFIGIEGQDKVHFAMPVRTMGYDFLSYDRQVKRIMRRHRKRKDLRGSAEFLSGFTPADLIAPTVTGILYFGDEPWNGPRSLKDMMKLEDFPESFRKLVNDYPLHIIDVKRFPHCDLFKTDLRLVFGFLQRYQEKERLFDFVNANEDDFRNMEDQAFDMMAAISHTEELMKFRNRDGKGGKVDMCKALMDMRQEAWDEGKVEGKAEGVELGIQHFILDNQEENVPKERILDKLCRRFDLTAKQAEDYYDKYAKY